MPTERFDRLPDEKKAAIRKAAIQEFIRVPFEKASINQIIYHANISRGSFYTYFEDKRDLLRYIFQDTKERMHTFCRTSITDHDGDWWKFIIELMEFSLEHCRTNNLFELSRNVMLYPDMEGLLESDCNEEEERHLEDWMYEQIDKSDFKDQTREGFHLIMELFMANVVLAVTQYYKKPENEEKIKKKFRNKIEMLRHGICN